MSKAIKYEMTWCDYLTPCPHENKSKDPAGIMVGDWKCAHCKFYSHRSKGNDEFIIYCNHF